MPGVVTAVESLAADAGARILRHGGNAADAAVATAFAQGVVNPIHCGIGGSFHGLFFDATSGRLMAVSSGGRAPKAATSTMFRPEGQWGAIWRVAGEANRLGYLASMVPGFVRGAWAAFDRFGSGNVSWAQVIEPAIELAEDGFDVYPYLYRLWMPATERMQGFMELLDGPTTLGHTEESRRVYLHDDGSVYRIGEHLTLRDYGATLRRVADNGADEFYEGETARRIADDFERNGGILSAADLRDFQPDVVEPLSTSFRDFQVFSEPAPTVGPVTLEVLNILEGWDLKSRGWNTPGYLDLLARAMHIGFRDRMQWVTDPDFYPAEVQRMISKEYAAEQREVAARGPFAAFEAAGGALAGETTHSTTVDAAGNAAAITHSTGVSSGVVTPGLGFQHNCHMIQFDPEPGQVNSIAPWKRAVTGGGPAFFMRDGAVHLAIGSPAGARKVTALIQAFLNVDDFGMSLPDAVAAYRIHAEDVPRQIIVEPHFPPEIAMGLAKLGYDVELEWYTARLTAVQRQPDGTLTGASDPRGDGGLVVVE
jgi:gamma-glutamyltranspeptidase/glutathione hydrolase